MTRSTMWYTLTGDAIVARGNPTIYSQRDFGRKMTYSPDEPRGGTPRLMIYDNEWMYS